MKRYEEGVESGNNSWKYLLIIGLIIGISIFLFLFVFDAEEEFCGNGVCDVEEGENYGNCPEDCDSGIQDNYCDGEEDGICDPDCEIHEDPDCEPVCGNDKCEEGENCYSCAHDCACGEDEYCSPEEKKCVEPECGNGVCEPMEDPSNCCLDWECTLPDQVCNEEKESCENLSFDISDSQGRNLVRNHYESKGETVVSVEEIGFTEFDGKLVKQYRVVIEGEEWHVFAGVTNEGEVVELPTT